MKFLALVLVFLLIGATITAGLYWYRGEGKVLIRQVREAEHKPFFL